jgi:hypothetical protein
MRFDFSQPASTPLPDLGYVALPAPAFFAEKSYTSECAKALQVPKIKVTKTAYSFVSQALADEAALTAAMTEAIRKRSLVPCPETVI